MDVQAELYYYNTYKSKVKTINIEIERLMIEYQGVNGMSYDTIGGGGTNAISRTVENEVMIRDRQIQRMKTMINQIQYRIDMIDAALESLSDLEMSLVTCRYLKGFTLYQTADIIGYSYSGVKKLNNKIISKLEFILGTMSSHSVAT